jgi:probable HAF family extracellular repeat protein
MSRTALMISVAVVGMVAAAPAMAKGTLYQLPLVSGSTETIAFGVTNNLNITGFWLDSSSIENGFVGPADGSNYTTWNDETGGGTQPRGINKKGYVTGIDDVGSGTPTSYIPYERSPSGTITDITMDGTALNYLAQGINKKGIFAGSYENSSSQIIGYTGKNAEYKKAITLPGITTTAVAGRGINDKGDIVGWYEDSSGVQHGFLLSGKTATTIDDPNGTTNLEGINNKGEISGLYTDSSGNRHGFTYDIKKAKFTELTVPNSTYVEVWGLNDNGVVAIDGENSSAVFVGYLYCPTANVCPSGGGAKSPQVPDLRHAPRQVPTLP